MISFAIVSFKKNLQINLYSRSNGFESKLAIHSNKRAAEEGEYYKNIQVYE